MQCKLPKDCLYTSAPENPIYSHTQVVYRAQCITDQGYPRRGHI